MASAEIATGQPAAARTARAFGILALLAIPGSLFTASATVPMALVALYALGLRLSGVRADDDVARLFWIFLACWAALLGADLLNGGALGNFQFTAVNYLPLLGAVGVAHVLRRAEIGDRAVAAALVLAIATATVISLYQYLVLGVGRPGGLFMNPIPYGLVVGMWGMFMLSLSLESRSWWLLGVALLAAVPIVLAESKIVWLATSVGYALVVLRWGIIGRRWRSLGIAAIAGVVLASTAYISVAHNRMDEFLLELTGFFASGDRSGTSFGHRAILAEAGWHAFLEGPLLGYGFVEHKDAAMAYVDPAGPSVAHLTHLHNDYVTHLVAYGYVGGAFLVAFFATLVWIGRNAADPARRSGAYALAAMAAIYMAGEIFLNIEVVTGPFAVLVGLLMMRPPRPSGRAAGQPSGPPHPPARSAAG
jgi:O-antigen ligase